MHVILLLVCGNISKDNFILFFVFFLTFVTWDRRWAFDSFWVVLWLSVGVLSLL